VNPEITVTANDVGRAVPAVEADTVAQPRIADCRACRMGVIPPTQRSV
jgi:hypothetical protein